MSAADLPEKVCKRGHSYTPADSTNRKGCPVCSRAAKLRYYHRNKDKVRAYQKKRWRRTQGESWKKYEKTPNGFLMRAYRNMKSRTTGVQKKKAHLYLGLSLCEREAFYAWSRNNPDFWRLYRAWVASGYERRLAPSVNRIDTSRGYDLDNIEWVTHSVNSSLAARPSEKALNATLRRLADRAA